MNKQILLSILILTGSLQAQWIQASGLSGSGVLSLSASGTNLIAGTSTDNIISSDNGKTWSSLNAKLSGVVYSFAAKGTNLYACTNSGILHSTDDGMDWSILGSGLSGILIYALAVSDTAFFAAAEYNWGYGAGVFRSTDNGVTWEPASTGLPSLIVYSITVSGTDLFAGTSQGLYRSTNHGANWEYSGLPLEVNAFAVRDTHIYAGTGNGVFLSTDNGTSWAAMDTVHLYCSISTMAFSGTDLFAGTYEYYDPLSGTYKNGLYRSTNNGASWINVSPVAMVVWSLTVRDADIYAGTDDGVLFHSTNSGTDWTCINAGLRDFRIISVIDAGARLFAGTYGAGIRVSTNAGTTWLYSGSEPRGRVVGFAMIGMNLFAGYQGMGVYCSTNYGESWTKVDTALANNYLLTLTVNGTDLIAGTTAGVFISSDSGITWRASGLPTLPVSTVAVIGTDLFAGGGYRRVYRSTNNGISWDSANTGLPNKQVMALAVSGADLFVATYGGGVFRSTNNGADWISASSGLTNLYVTSFAVRNRNVFAGTHDGVFLSTDNGTNWTEVNTGFPASDRAIHTLATNLTSLFAGTYSSGVWRRQLSDMITSVELWSDLSPYKFRLQQNYPNPFNPSTVIRFDLPRRSDVSLKLYDLLGREVAVLVNKTLDAGSYTTTVHVERMATGTYLYRLQAGAYQETRKLLLLR